MKVGKLIVFAAVLGLATGAGAATVYTGTSFAWDISSPVAVGLGAVGEDLVAFQLTLVNTTGIAAKNPQAIDASPDPNNPPGNDGIQTVGGAFLHNEQDSDDFTPGLYLITPDVDTWAAGGAPSPSLLDSYWLQASPTVVSGFPLREDSIAAHLPLSSEAPQYGGASFVCGWTDGLEGIFAMGGTNTSANWDLAYLVVPCGTQIRVDVAVSGGDGVKEEFDFTFDPCGGAVIPVPAALPLGFAGLLLAMRRRVA